MEYNVNRYCPKCGGVASTTYDTVSNYYEKCGRLRRCCIRCGYIWYEESLDRKGNENE